MKKVLFVIPYLADGGSERVVSIWASELSKFDCDVNLLLFYRVENEYVVNDKVMIHTIAHNREEYKEMSILKKVSDIRKMLKYIKPDVVLPFIDYVGILVNIAHVGLPVRIIETVRIDPRCSPKKKLVRFIRDLSVYLSRGCIVQTKSQLQYFPVCFRKKMAVLSNPISPNILNYEKKFTDNKIKKIIAVGRLEKQKNFPMLIKAFLKIADKYPDLALEIYGEGSLRTEISELIYELKLEDSIQLCGYTSNIAQALCDSDLFVLPSNAEGMPNSLMEAMAIGLPCISTDCQTGPKDLIKSGYNGYLTPVGDTKALITTIENILGNVGAAIEMGNNARKTIISNYSANESAMKLLDYLNNI